jgi:serine/threonine protein phosphatase PrpC
MFTLHWGSATDVGQARPVNEDSLWTSPTLFVVADGMGGHAAGEVASALAVAEFERLAEVGALRPADLLDTIGQANDQIVAAGAERGDRLPMGTTLTGVAVLSTEQGQELAVFNVGDSRVYRFAEGRLSQLTVDHSAVQELIDAGQLSREAARTHPRRNVVTRSLGTMPPPAPDIWVLPPVPGDRFVICSDGLTTELEDAEIAETVAAHPAPDAAAQALVRRANHAGGRDNVTIIVLDVAAVPDDAVSGDQQPDAAIPAGPPDPAEAATEALPVLPGSAIADRVRPEPA